MAMLTVTNTHASFSSVDINSISASNRHREPYSVSISRRFVNLSSRNANKLSFLRFRVFSRGAANADARSLGGGGGGGGVIEKDFEEFRPNFNEYLKTMESVKTDREKQQAHRSNVLTDKNHDEFSGDRKVRNFDNVSLVVDDFKSKRRRHESDDTSSSDTWKRKGQSLDGRNINVTIAKSQIPTKRVIDEGFVPKKIVIDDRNASKYGKLTRNPKAFAAVDNQMLTKNFVDERSTWKNDKLAKNHNVFSAKNDVTAARNQLQAKGYADDCYLPEEVVMDGRNTWKSGQLKGNRNSFSAGNDVRVVKNHMQSKSYVDQRYLPQGKTGKLTRNPKKYSDGDNSLNVQRAAFKFYDESDDVVDKPRISRQEMDERIEKLAKELNGADINMPEWIFSRMMRSARIKYTDHSILRVIQILGKLGNWRQVLHVIEWLQRGERFKSFRLRFIYTTALNALGKARRPVEALNVFHAMQGQLSSYPDIVAYRSIAVTLGQAGHMKELFDVIDSMRSPSQMKFKTGASGASDPRLEPDIVVYHAVLNACVHKKQWEGAFWVLQQLEQQHIRASSTTYGLIMEVMFACGKYNLVHEFFMKLQKSSFPTALSYRVLLNTLWKEGKTDEAVEAVGDMERRGIVGSAALYYDLARCLCSAGRCQEALKQIEKICKVASKPLVVTYTGLIQACLDAGNIQNGVYIFNQMKDFCSPNVVTCNIMLKAYFEHGLFEEAKQLFKKMSENADQIGSTADYKTQILPDIYTFNTMLDACAAQEKWDDFDYVYTKMLSHGHHFNSKRHLRMILDACRAGKVELLETIWKHLLQSDRVPPPALVKERFCTNLEKGDYVSALSSIADLEISEFESFTKSAWSRLLEVNSQRFPEEAFARLIDELSAFIRRSVPNPVLKNLLASCKEFSSKGLSMGT